MRIESADLITVHSVTYVLSNFSANEEIDMENLYEFIRSDISSMINNHSFLIEEIRFNSKQKS